MASASVSEKAAEARYSISPEIHEIIHPPKPSKPSTMSSSSSYTSSEAKVIVKPKRRSARAGSAHKAKGRARHKKNNMAERKRPPEQNTERRDHLGRHHSCLSEVQQEEQDK